MIQLITGVPGSGKTLLSLKLLTDKYFYYDSKHKNFYLNPKYQDITIITNIKDLKLPHLHFPTIFKDNNLSFESFFNVTYQEKITKKYPKIIYIIDEAQEFLNRKLKDPKSILYFDTHRHFNHQIYLITQNFKKLHLDISSLVEFEYRLSKRTFSITGEFTYLVKSSGTIFERRSFRPPKKLFKIYKSFTANDNQPARKNPILKYIAIPLILFLCTGFYFYSSIKPKNPKRPIKSAINNFNSKDIIPKKKVSGLFLKSDQKLIIKNKIIKDNKLFLFQCPITGKFCSPKSYPFDISYDLHDYYITVSKDQINDYKVAFDFVQSLLNPNNLNDDPSSKSSSLPNSLKLSQN